MRTLSSLLALFGTVALSLAACGGAQSSSTHSGSDAGGGGDASQTGDDASVSGDDGGTTADTSMSADSGDGTPTRQQCTNSYGTSITTAFGRLDGFLVAIVQPGAHGCNADTDHVHLQVKANGGIYDVAVNINSTMDPSMPEVYLLEKDMAMPDGAWAEGWHPGVRNDYVQLGLHSTQFMPMPAAMLAQTITSALANANHISVFATGYGPTGIHDVHRRGGGTDGAIVIDPQAQTSHILFFHFASQTF
ncbi:MAG TPA: hypothetical protein VE987_01145 [Polyangiaceae bacterium]|nr:hypothetical protein [Polyangiaceae bacterium]